MDTRTMPQVALESRLLDGTPVLYRPIRPDDKGKLQRGLEQLSSESRYRRFFREIERFSDEELRYLTEIDFVDHVAWMALLPNEPGEPGIGVGRWIRLRDEPAAAEAAVTVIDAYQNRGVGKFLLHLLARSAIESGVESFRVWALWNNGPILHLLRALGAVPGKREGGTLELTVPLPPTTEALDATPAPVILKATAAGRLTAGAHGDAGAACHFEA
jgi:GNAT superfamily N-acetyltransferase